MFLTSCSNITAPLSTQISRQMGFQLADPRYFTIQRAGLSSYVNALKGVTAMQVQMVMIIVPNKSDAALYQAIKVHCTCECPTPSQVVTATLLKKPRGQLIGPDSIKTVTITTHQPSSFRGKIRRKKMAAHYCFDGTVQPKVMTS